MDPPEVNAQFTLPPFRYAPRRQGELIHVVESTIDNDSTSLRNDRGVRGGTLLSD